MRWSKMMHDRVDDHLEVIFCLFHLVLVEVGPQKDTVESDSLCMQRQYLLDCIFTVLNGLFIVALFDSQVCQISYSY